MKYTFAYLLGAATASMWWLAYSFPTKWVSETPDVPNQFVIVAAIFTFVTQIYIIACDAQSSDNDEWL